MGFATSITVTIIFLAIIIISTITFPIMIQSYEKVQESKDDKHEIQMEQLNTAIDITDITAIGADILLITVTNEGTIMLHANECSVLVDGIITNYSVNPSGFWSPQNYAVFTVSAKTNQDHVIKITTELGISDMETFYK